MRQARAKTRLSGLALPLVLLLALLAGCQWLGEMKQDFDPRLAPADQAYQQALEPYLVQGVVYNGPATELKAKVLPLGPTVRQARALRTAQAQTLDPAATQALLAEQARQAPADLEVMVSLYVPERQWSDLTARNPDWKLYILDGAGRRLEPKDIRLIRERERSALNQTLHPFWGSWDRLFKVTFPAPQAPARLLITGAPGHVEVPLKLD